MKFFDKIINILTKPSEFFLKIEKEKGIKHSIIYFSVLTIINVFLSFILILIFKEKIINLYLNLFNISTQAAQFNFQLITTSLLIGIPITILSTFVAAAIIYVWLMIFKSDKDYQTAYKLYTYSETPSLLFGWIPIVSLFAKIYFLILLIIGTHKIYKFSPLKSTLIYLIPIILISILVGIL
ncbi:MAG: YIP1 family protein, partial [Nanoarchaeota archaeon]